MTFVRSFVRAAQRGGSVIVMAECGYEAKRGEISQASAPPAFVSHHLENRFGDPKHHQSLEAFSSPLVQVNVLKSLLQAILNCALV